MFKVSVFCLIIQLVFRIRGFVFDITTHVKDFYGSLTHLIPLDWFQGLDDTGVVLDYVNTFKDLAVLASSNLLNHLVHFVITKFNRKNFGFILRYTLIDPSS